MQTMPPESSIKTSTPHEDELPTGSESILIGDYEVDLLSVAEQYPGELGYHTYLADSTVKAMEILEKEEGISLLFSDVVMPGGMNGYELAQRATELNPDIKVLLTSGYTSKVVSKNTSSRFAANLLNKPYRKDILAQQIRLVLDEATET